MSRSHHPGSKSNTQFLIKSLSLTESKENDKASSSSGSSSKASSPQSEVDLEEKKIVSDSTEAH